MELFIPTFPDYEHIDDGKRARLLRDYHFAINGLDLVIRKGFEWDGASIPWFMRWKYGSPFDFVHLVGGLIHDAIYANRVYVPGLNYPPAEFKKLEADNIYFALIRKFGATILRAAKEWFAVAVFGWSHWTKR